MIVAAVGLAVVLSAGAFLSTPILLMQESAGEKTVVLDSTPGTVTDRADEARLMLATLNSERVSAGLAVLRLDPTLTQVARTYATTMATHHFFGHTSPDGETPFTRLKRAHHHWHYAGENIALAPSADMACHALWDSEEHRANILEPRYAKVGIAAISAPAGEIFVEDFSD